MTIVGEDGQPKQKSFRALLLTKCQQEFEKDKKEDEHLEQLKAAVEAAETVSGYIVCVLGACMSHACREVYVCYTTAFACITVRVHVFRLSFCHFCHRRS